MSMHVFFVVMHIIQPFDAYIHAGLVCEIAESIHVVAVGFVCQILTINDPMRVLIVAFGV